MAEYKSHNALTPKKFNRTTPTYPQNKIVKGPNTKQLAQINSKLATGVAIHTVVNSRTSTNVLSNINDYNNPDVENRNSIVKLARSLRKIEGICSSVADLLADFGVTNGGFISDNDELKLLLNKWAAAVNGPMESLVAKGMVFPVAGLRAACRKIFDDYITDGDAVFTLYWKNNVKINENDAKGFFLPITIKALDTTSLSIDPDLAKLGIEQIELKIDDRLKRKIQNPESEADKFLVQNFPKEWKKAIDSNTPIILSPDVTYHMKRNGKDYKPWGESMFLKAFTAIAAKKRIQAVDDATIDGLINRFTVFKLGLPDKEKNPAYHIPSPNRVNALVSILQNPKRNNAIVWPGPDLEIEDFGPDGKILEFDQKYVQADKDILRALHVSPVLIDGTLGTQGSSKDWMNFLSTEVGLDTIRAELEQIFTRIGKDIALANSMQYEELYFKFEPQTLKNEKSIRNFAIKLYELGVISVETFLTLMGQDFDTEKRLKENEKNNQLNELFVNPNVPGFTNTNKDSDGGDGRPTNETKSPDVQPDTEAQASVAVSGNPLNDLTSYYTMLHKSFMSLSNKVVHNYNLTNDLDMAKMTLINGYSEFHSFVAMEIRNVYRKATGGNSPKEELAYLMQWNDVNLTKFYDELFESIKISKEAFLDKIERSQYRVFLYAQESFKKAYWVGTLAMAKLRGKTHAKWVCYDPETSACSKNHEKIFDIQSLITNFPGHPNCLCKLEVME